MKCAASSAAAVLAHDSRSSSVCWAQPLLVMQRAGCSPARIRRAYGEHELLPQAAEDLFFWILWMVTPQQPLCTVGFVGTWDSFPRHESGHDFAYKDQNTLREVSMERGDYMGKKGRGEEGGPLL